MTDRPYRRIPDPDDRHFATFKFKPGPPTPGERALEIYYARLAEWHEERRRRREDQAEPTS